MWVCMFYCLSVSSLVVCLLNSDPTLTVLNLLVGVMFYMAEMNIVKWLNWVKIISIFNIYSENYSGVFVLIAITLYF